MGRRVLETTAKFPWLVAETDTVLGYAYARAHRIVASYAWSVEVAIYIAPEAQRRGVARALYASLFAVLRLQGYQNAYAGITVPNAPSRALHEAIGFQLVGTYRRVACKNGRWLDLEWFALALGSHPPDPKHPKPLPEVVGTPEFERALLTAP
jgi:phosphinothricin acetyltransferase